MSQPYIKNTLKSAKEAIHAKNYEEAVKNCKKVIEYEADNYVAHVFLGVAYLNLNKFEESETAYLKAIEINSSKSLAWEGLEKFYEKRENWVKLAETWQSLLKQYNDSKDAKKVLETINKLIDLYKNKEKNKKLLVATLNYLSPSSPYYESIKNEKDFPKPVKTLQEIAELLELYEAETLKREVETRRQRLNAGSLASIQEQVREEVYLNSELGDTYERLLRMAKSDEEDIDYKSLSIKYVDHLHKKLAAVPRDVKHVLREKLSKMAQELVDQDAMSSLAYEIIIEGTNARSPDDYDRTLLQRYLENFPETGLSKFIQGYLSSKEGEDIDVALKSYNNGFDINKNSMFGHHSISWLYHDLKDYKSALEYAENGRNLVLKKNKETDQLLDRVQQSLDLCMANCYLNLDSKYHSDASSLYQKVLEKDQNNVQALQGFGRVLFAQKQYDKANETFHKALQLDPENHFTKSEIGWIQFSLGEYENALKTFLQIIEMNDETPLHFYRLGRVYWAMGEDYRTDKSYAYAQFIQAAKLDPQFGGVFTYLGHYYRMIKDHTRAKKCYQKAFSIDPRDEEAGLRLSECYQSDGEEDFAEVAYRTAIQANNKAGWAWKRLGFTELANKKYLDAITTFQTALRMDVKDVNCWEGMAEAYQQEGRYMASLKAFMRAIELDKLSVYSHYKVAALKQKLGLFDEAIAQFDLTIEKSKAKGEQDHVPSLKGLGDCRLALAREYFQGGFYGRTADSITEGLLAMLRAIKASTEIQIFWKLIGDLCITAQLIPNYLNLIPLDTVRQITEIACQSNVDTKLHFPKDIDNIGINLLKQSDSQNAPSVDSLVSLLTSSCIAYKHAIFLSDNNPEVSSTYWHDLALAYYYLYETTIRRSKDAKLESSPYFSVAIKCIKVALKFEPDNFEYWNALGVMTLTTNAKISQHSFIKAMGYSPKCPIPWSNIGFLYLLNSDLELANKAFTTSQTLDPDFVPAWVGQAYIANLWESDEATDLFEHAFEISGGGYLLEADYGFAYNAFTRHSLQSSSRDALLISPAFALQKLTEQRPDDVAALNLLGLVLERLDQPENAAEAFTRAVLALEELAQQQEHQTDSMFARRLACVQANLGRVLCATKDFPGSINAYSAALQLTEQNDVDAFRIYSQMGAGLAYYFNNQLENSMQMFEICLDATEKSSGLKEVHKDVVVLLSQVLWACRGEEHRDFAKKELFQCINQNPNHLPAIFALCAMGLLQDDDTLATAASREMTKLPFHVADELDQNHDIDFLLSRYFLLQDTPERATLSLTRSVHIKPTDLKLWSNLASHLISIASPIAAILTSRSALGLLSIPSSLASTSTLEKSKCFQNLAASLLLKIKQDSDATGTEGNDQRDEGKKIAEALSAAQRAVTIAPWDIAGWSLLGIAHKGSRSPGHLIM